MITQVKKPIHFIGIKSDTALSNLPDDTFLVAHKYCQRCSFANSMIPQGDITARVLWVGKTFNTTPNDDRFFHTTLKVLGITHSDVLYIGALGCYLSKDLTEEELRTAMERCFVWKQELLKRMPNLRYIILSGIHAYQLFYGHMERLTDHVGYIFESEVFGKVVNAIPIPSPVYLARNQAQMQNTMKILAEMGKIICQTLKT